MLENGAPSVLRIGTGTTENKAAKKALAVSNALECDMCVAEIDTDKVVQRIWYRPELKTERG